MNRLEFLRRLSWPVIAIVLVLLIVGWLGVARSEEFREDASLAAGRLVRQQVVFSLLAITAMFAVPFCNYRIFIPFSYGIFAATVVLLLVVLFCPEVNGAHRWIRLGRLGLQPSEFAKVAFILAMARYLMHRENYRRLSGLLVPLGITLIPVLLIFKEPDLGVSLVFLPVLFAMLFTAGSRRGNLATVILLGMLLLPLLWTQMSREQQSRVTSLLDQPTPGQRLSDDSRQLYQGKRMMAMGGVWGSLATEPASDDPAAYQLPEAQNDFIFCVVGERLGLWGQGLVLLLYVLLVWRGMRISAQTREPYGRLVAVGVVALIAVEAIINTGMSTGLLPITGLSLPLVSYGGSGLLAHGIALGLLLSVGCRPGYEVAGEPFRYVAD